MEEVERFNITGVPCEVCTSEAVDELEAYTLMLEKQRDELVELLSDMHNDWKYVDMYAPAVGELLTRIKEQSE